ncbi:phage tail tape measure protein [Paenibacillus sp.]|jgi:TP901 family phage tail tape measure protein|uniref:phage tail tape measure protein n=1 Tax=Paenibacillus sp. TaxID=58172 RepID=UPI002817B6F8|nr:phage tail tape measure protein [Paenibacillus sp.]MDR0269643.1 phage tail tape measure protein [Paenibacillus sp.]
MADGINKDVVGARINLDTSKILPAFKLINEGARGNAESFKVLNAELSITTKNFTALANAADKIALSSEERRKKILAESEAIIKQRTAQTELLNAKKNHLEQTNNLVDAKLQVQQSIVKKHEATIEQQAKEHQQRMITLLQKTSSAEAQTKMRLEKERQSLKLGNDKIEQQEQQHQQKMEILKQKSINSGSQDNLIQAKIDRQFQLTKNGNRKIEMEEERHAAQMVKLAGAGTENVLNRSSQYMLSGTMYYAVIRGADEAIKVLKDFEYELVNVKRIMGDTADVGFVKESMISNAKEYGYALTEVADVYTQIAQQGFDERQTEALARTALMAANVEQSFQSAAQAQDLMTGAILNYGMAAQDSERLLDRLNEVSNNYPTTSKKLLEGINRVGAAAKNAGVDIDTLIGYLTVLNQSGFSGSIAGNAIKSFISFSSRDIAVEKLEKYVGVMKKANGEMMPFSELLGRISQKWATLTDVERAEITQAIARGDQASRFIALMNNYSKTIEVAAASQNSFGSAQRENALAMTTLEKQSMQLKAAWDELIVSVGDSGLLNLLKQLTQTATTLVDGFNSLPAPVKNTMISVLLLGGAITVLNTGMKLLTGQSLFALITGLANGARAMLGLKAATDAANLSQKAFVATPIGAALTAISIAIGAATTAWAYYKGTQNEISAQTEQDNRDMSQLVKRYEQLKGIVDDNTKSDKEVTAAKQELATVIEKISGIMPNLISQWDELGKAKDVDAQKIEEWKQKYADSVKVLEQANLEAAQKRKAELENEIEYTRYAIRNASEADLSIIDKAMGKTVNDLIHKWSKEVVNLGSKLAEEERKIKNSQDTIDALNGVTSKAAEETSNLSHSVSETSDAMGEYGDSAEAATDAQDEQYQSAEDLAKAHAVLESQVQGNSKAISELNTLSRDLSEGQSLNAANAADLIIKYPQLADSIYKTADGWAFEKDAVELLRKAKIQKAIDDLKSEQASAFNTKMHTDSRLKAYGIEMEAIKNLADLKAKLNGVMIDHADYNYDTLSSDPAQQAYRNKKMNEMEQQRLAQKKEIDAIYSEYESQQKNYESRIKSLTVLYKDNRFGVSPSSSEKKKSSGSKKKDKSASDAFSAAQKQIEHKKAMGQLTTSQELAAWQKLQSQYKQGSEQRMTIDEKVYALKKQLIEEAKQKEKEAFDASMKWMSHQKAIREVSAKDELDMLKRVQARYKVGSEERYQIDERVFAAKKAAEQESLSKSDEWISHQKGIREVSAAEELEMLLRVQSRYKVGTDERMKLDERVYAAKKSAEQEMFTMSQEWISHQKAMDQLSTEQELKAWERIQARYLEGTKLRMQADEQVYALKKKLLEDEKNDVTELAKTQKTTLDKAKNEEIKRIEEERDAFLSAQDEKIKAIDDQIKKMEQLYEEDDYERKLAEKQARLELLQSAVGPDGIRERKQVQKDIEEMQRQHERTLARKSLEEQKQQLQDERNQKEKDYNNQIQTAKDHYDELSNAFENFSSDIELQAENLKQVQILKESEKNNEILKQLDQFIEEYQSKMSKITQSQAQLSQKDLDLQEYNGNKDAYEAAKTKGNIAEMKRLSERNQQLRDKYGISKDTGKLQHFKDGGIVQGQRGQAVPVVAHAGEMYLNDQQQSNLFKLLNFKMPKFTMPDRSSFKSTVQNPVVNHNYFTVTSGNTYIEDGSAAKVYWSERDNFIRRSQVRAGAKAQ